MKKKLLFLLISVSLFTTTYAQFNDILKKKAGEGVKLGAEVATEKAANAAINKLFNKTKHEAPLSNDTVPAKQKTTYQLPPSFTFEWEVKQEKHGEDEDGKFTYYFTTNGEYAAAKNEEKDENNFIIYDKNGSMLMFNEKKKTITVMNMIRAVAGGAEMSKEVAEKINKKPLEPDKDDDMTLNKTGKTKMIAGYTADEYLIKSDGGTFSCWYVNAPFDPVKIYTMGAGRPDDISKLKNDPKMKNNMMAIPVLNKNYLMAKMEVKGKKGLETKSITKKTTTIPTAGYKIIDMSNKSFKEIITSREE